MQRENEASGSSSPDYTHNLLSRTVSSATSVAATATNDNDEGGSGVVAIVGGLTASTATTASDAAPLTVTISVDSMPVLSLPRTTPTSPVAEQASGDDDVGVASTDVVPVDDAHVDVDPSPFATGFAPLPLSPKRRASPPSPWSGSINPQFTFRPLHSRMRVV